ncbi:PKD domain-containing protein [Kordiimonas lacus]|uniref:PKD domain-containing protein n=1 Tax=Kordiimonas lacus TaxID=637679 RepID=A0A1G7A3K1_9PROT|nr:PKD domain-containing protein [Kordiimonas lacus]SDE09382.1 PKD domain-containing protein [Kordiimonas lacus]
MTHIELNKLQYPIFEANQVLSSNHLNELLSYLDTSDRATRREAIGSGWLGGAEASFELTGTKLNRIRLSCGAGITSLGFLAVLDDCVLEYAFDYEDPFEQTLDDDNGTIRKGYEPFWTGTGQNRKQIENMFELRTDDEVSTLSDAEKQSARAKFTDITARDYVLLVYVEADQEDIKSCFQEDCTDRGQRMLVNVRRIAMRKADIVPQTFDNGRALATISPLRMKRITSYTGGNLAALYAPVFDDMITGLANALTAAFRHFQPYLQEGMTWPTRQQFVNRLTSKRNATPREQVQVYYDFLRDLVSAYNDLLNDGLPLVSRPCADKTAFPRHLLVSEMVMEEPLAPYKAARHYFLPTVAVSGEEEAIWRLRRGFEKIHTMLDLYQPNRVPIGDIQVRPQKRIPSSHNLIPYYYHMAGQDGRKLKDLWNPARARHVNASDAASHHGDPGPNPFLQNIDDQQMIRVEGILGHTADAAITAVKNLRERFELAFAVEEVYLDGGFPAGSLFDLADDQNQYGQARAGFVYQLKSVQLFLTKTLPGTDPWILYLSKQVPSAKALIDRMNELAQALPDHVTRFNQPLFLQQYMLMLDEAAAYRDALINFIRSVLDAPLRSRGIVQPGTRQGSPYHVMVTLALCELTKYLERLFGGLDPNPVLATHEIFEAHRRQHQVDDPRAFANFYRKHRGLEHIAGVTWGGTLILLIADGKIVGDFYLPYVCCCDCPPRSTEILQPEIYPFYHQLVWQKEVRLGSLESLVGPDAEIYVSREKKRNREDFADFRRFMETAERLSDANLPVLVDDSGSALYIAEADDGQYLALAPAPEAIGKMVDFVVGTKGRGVVRYPFWVSVTTPLMIAHDDFAVTNKEHLVMIEVIRNDLLPTPHFRVSITKEPEFGRVEFLDEKSAFLYKPFGKDGQRLDEFHYQLISFLPTGERLVSHARVTVHIVECCEHEDPTPTPDPIPDPEPTGGDVTLPESVFCIDDKIFYEFKFTGTARNLRGKGIGYLDLASGRLNRELTGRNLTDAEVRDLKLKRVFVPASPDIRPGKVEFAYTITDDTGQDKTQTFSVTVFRLSNVISSVVDPNDFRKVKFSYGFEPDDGDLEYRWYFGETDTRLGDLIFASRPDSTRPTPTHAYRKAGTYTVHLFVQPKGSKSCQHHITKQMIIIDPTVIVDIGDVIRDRPTRPIVVPGPRPPRPGVNFDLREHIAVTARELDSFNNFSELLGNSLSSRDGLRRFREGSLDKKMGEEATKVLDSVKKIADADRDAPPAERFDGLPIAIENPSLAVAGFFGRRETITPEAKEAFRKTLETMEAGKRAGVKYSDDFVRKLDAIIERSPNDEATRHLKRMRAIAVT